MDCRSIYEFKLQDGRRILFRHSSADDAERVAIAVRTASEQTLFHRFFRPIRKVSMARLRELLDVDRSTGVCVLGEMSVSMTDPLAPTIVCGFRLLQETPDDLYEFALTVHDTFQRQGIGTFMMAKLADEAIRLGLRTIRGTVMESNVGMQRLVQKLCPNARRHFGPGLIEYDLDVNELARIQPGQRWYSS